eukprot:2248565-Amphidinium_carterae.1
MVPNANNKEKQIIEQQRHTYDLCGLLPGCRSPILVLIVASRTSGVEESTIQGPTSQPNPTPAAVSIPHVGDVQRLEPSKDAISCRLDYENAAASWQT